MLRSKWLVRRVHFEHEHRVALLGADGRWWRSCVLIEASETGARLLIEGAPDVLRSKHFFLLLSKTGLAFRRCELVRLDGCEADIEYVTARTARIRPKERHAPLKS
ncbi:PilZ domain-containing protein [Bradyrhizobium yuanmingense]|nr:PilZ domain-containing protein [Bradyrhizobium yuanmingense]MDF0497330.1 PilZ domain-containing protein [Bradyrhizobium yuanmingense]